VLLVVAAWAAPSSAHGEVAGATELFRQGVAAFREGSYPEAASLFRLSYDMEARAETQCNLALTYERWGGHDMEALESYRRCAEDDTDGSYRPRALERAQQIRQRLQTEGATETTAPEPGGGGTGQQGDGGDDGSAAAGSDGSGGGGTGPRQRGMVISRPLLWTGLGVGVLAAASLGTAIGLHVWTAGIHDDLSSTYGDRPIATGSDDAERVSQGETGVGAALGLYIVGGVLAAAATVLVLIDLTQESDPVEATLISVMPTPSGLMVGGRFSFD